MSREDLVKEMKQGKGKEELHLRSWRLEKEEKSKPESDRENKRGDGCKLEGKSETSKPEKLASAESKNKEVAARVYGRKQEIWKN